MSADNVVIVYLDCGDVSWLSPMDLDRIEKEAPPYYVTCKACSSDQPVAHWERRGVENDVDLYNWLAKKREP